ncbi:hypothetical protein [Bradyrhizobium sp.]|uniref:hypothetical protein n=1 Tax=Bradyrhizobium sp. TaxID=376 RepID=UPI003C4322B6
MGVSMMTVPGVSREAMNALILSIVVACLIALATSAFPPIGASLARPCTGNNFRTFAWKRQNGFIASAIVS